jgi:hypothetical protein
MSGTSSHSIMIHDAPQKLSQPFVSFHVEIFFLTLLGLDGSLGGHFHVEILFTIIHNYIFFYVGHLYLVSEFILNVCINEYK